MTATYPRTNEHGDVVWACCESSIGQPCQHREPLYGSENPSDPAYRAWLFSEDDWEVARRDNIEQSRSERNSPSRHF